MIIDARVFESICSISAGGAIVPESVSQKEYLHHGIVLRFIDAKEIAGNPRIYYGADTHLYLTGVKEQNLFSKNPVHLIGGTGYRVVTHIHLDKVPDGVMAKVIPYGAIDECGFTPSPAIIDRVGNVRFSVCPMHSIEIGMYSPVALLVFEKVYIPSNEEGEDSTSKEHSKSEGQDGESKATPKKMASKKYTEKKE